MKTPIVKSNLMKTMSLVLALFAAGGLPAWAQDSELDKLKANMQQMQKNMEEMQKKIMELEKEKTNAPAAAPSAIERTSPSFQTLEKVAAGEAVGHASQVAQRPALNDQQEGAQRPKDFTLDPTYHGFVPIPNTPALIKFNAKPRVDVTSDTRNSGNPDRFVTAQIPVEGQPAYGGSEQFNVNARGSQLSLDVRAPSIPGDFRFYYNNDFFGSGSGMQYRLKQLYGQFYNVTAGFTYSCFEDPDAWPDTVDFEGPNAVIFARRALVRYMLPLSEAWQMNFGVEAPGSEVDGNSTPNPISAVNSAPDGTMNVRWENAKWGHVQLGGVARSIGANQQGVGSDSVFGWGLNLASSMNLSKRDAIQGQLTYGEGVFRYMNDDFVNNDAAYDSSGNLRAIPCFGATVGYTHQWSDVLRSTATYGYVHLDNESTQGPDAYHQTYYGSVNLVWQLRKHLSIGAEALYGKKETQNGQDGDVWRFQMSLVYSLFD
jgi:hypothetical protein